MLKIARKVANKIKDDVALLFWYIKINIKLFKKYLVRN